MPMDYAERARALVGSRFRLQGRNLEGLDCVGVVIATFGIEPAEVRRNYRLREGDRGELSEKLGKYFRRVSRVRARAGDVMVMAIDKRQLHLAVRTVAGFVHAHAGIGRVVETPGEPQWKVIDVFRKRLRARSD